MRRDYLLTIEINNRLLRAVRIDPHYESKHSKSINDQIIIELVKTLNGGGFTPVAITDAGYGVYVNDMIPLGGKWFRLVWTLHPNENYLGVINAFRRSHAKIPK